jgi:diaminohydroxyphosphoribosylaminopyrimidine deaminase / 5-amino-6-(5-phosphoribosylamino)uracil reductase
MSDTALVWTAFERQAMARALELAARGQYSADPNPRVGCVLAQGERIVGEGWHERAGEPHAEPRALLAAGGAARGATAFVTLEPCAHFGRTPPCSQALIDAGVSRVVYALQDPNPRVAGAGALQLRAAGIAVKSGLLAIEAEQMNRGYLCRMRKGRPYVRVKLAASLDGHTALASGESRWITSKAARQDVQHYRALSSVVLTGVGTILADDPALNVRLEASTRQPLRVVLDSSLRTPSDSRVLHREGAVLLYGATDHVERRHSLERQNASIEMRAGKSGRVDLDAVLHDLAARQANEVWVEAGATLAGAFIREQLFDELVIYLAPTLLGHGARPLLELPALQRLEDRPRLRFTSFVSIGDDLRITAVPES